MRTYATTLYATVGREGRRQGDAGSKKGLEAKKSCMSTMNGFINTWTKTIYGRADSFSFLSIATKIWDDYTLFIDYYRHQIRDLTGF